MSDDPETLRQIEELAADDRPLLVLDVDDVLLEFIRPFPRFLEAQGYELSLSSFQLNGNIREIATGVAAEKERVGELIDAFFHAQADWQSVTEGAAVQRSDRIRARPGRVADGCAASRRWAGRLVRRECLRYHSRIHRLLRRWQRLSTIPDTASAATA